MFANVKFQEIDGADNGQNLILFGLTTCGYCKKASEYLKNTGLKYRYVYLDEFPLSEKQNIKNEFKEKYKKKMLFPTLIIDDDYLTGFIKILWDSNIKKVNV